MNITHPQETSAAAQPKSSLRRTYHLVFAALLVLALAQLALSLWCHRVERALAASQQRQYASQLFANELRLSFDDQTRMARSFAATGDPRFETYHQQIIAIRDGRQPRPADYDKVYWELVIALGRQPPVNGEALALEERMRRAGFTEAELARLNAGKRQAETVLLLERVAMNAVKGSYRDATGQFTRSGAPNRAYAIQLLHGPEYQQARTRVLKPLHDAQRMLDQRTGDDIRRLNAQATSLAQLETATLLATVVLVIVAFLILNRQMIAPLQELTASAAGVGRNGFFRRVLAGRDDELGQLAATLNRLSETVEDKIRAAEAHEERLRNVLAAAPDALLLSDGDGRITAINQRAEALLGVPRTEAEGKPLATLLPELGPANPARRSGMNCEIRVRPGDIRELTVEVMQNVIEQAGGQLLVCTTLRDRSADKTAKAERERQALLQSATFDALRQPAFATDEAGRITTVNQTFEQVFGLNREAVVGKSVTDLDFIPDGERRQLDAELRELAQSGARLDRELPVLDRDGFERMNRLAAEGFRLAEGAAGGAVAALTDVTERRRLEAELAATRLELGRVREEANGMRESLARVRDEVAGLRGDAAASQTEAATLREELENAQSQLTNALDSASAAENRASELKLELEEANARLVELAIAQAQAPAEPGAGEAADDAPPMETEEQRGADLEPSTMTQSPTVETGSADMPAAAASTERDPDWTEEPPLGGENETPGSADVDTADPSLELAPEAVDEPAPAIDEEPTIAGHSPATAVESFADHSIDFESAAETGPQLEVPRSDTTAPASRDETLDEVPPPTQNQPEEGAGNSAAESKPAKRKRTPRKKKERDPVQTDLFGGYDGAKDESGPVRVTVDPDGVPVVSGLDLRDAVNRLELPTQAVVQMVVQFAEGLPQTFSDLRTALAGADREAARRHAHTLAGAAGSFSADTLRRLAKTLELALKFEQGDAGRMLAELEREAARVMEAGRQLMAMFGDEPLDIAMAATNAGPAGIRKLLTILEELSTALGEGDIEAISQAVEPLKSESLPPGLRADYERLSELIDNFEYGDAAAIARSMMERLK